MNILFIHEKNWLTKSVFELHSIPEILSLKGHNLYAVDYPEDWTKKDLFDLGTLKPYVVDIQRVYKDAKVKLIRPGFIKIPGISRASATLTHYIEIKEIIKKENIEAIILYSVPTNGLQATYLAKKYNIPIIFRSIDILHELVPYSFLRFPTYILEKIVYSRVDKIIAITYDLIEYCKKLSNNKTEIELVPLGVDTRFFYPKNPSPSIRKKWNITKNDKVILYLGRLYTFSGIDRLILKFPHILSEVPEAKFLIVGRGELLEKIKDLIKSTRLEDKVIVTGQQPYLLVPDFINLADICINPFKIFDMTNKIVPTKIYQYLSCGKPVVSSNLRGTKRMLPPYQSGVVYEDNIDSLVNKIIDLLKNQNKLKELSKNGLKFIRGKHSNEIVAEKIEGIIETLKKKKEKI